MLNITGAKETLTANSLLQSFKTRTNLINANKYCKLRSQFIYFYITINLISTSVKCQLFDRVGPLPNQQIFNNPYFSDKSVEVLTEMGKVIGKTVYLYDGPNRSAFDRSTSHLFKPPNSWQEPSLPHVYKNVTIFLGIPYAKAPLRENGLRFKLPQQTDKWGMIIADKYRPACPQPTKYTGIERSIPQTDEDCLYLNIFTPFARPRVSKLFPVIVHIHGGKFEHGSGNAFPGHMLAASQDVVVVTLNYRLGVLGFIATADNSSAGNYGLADQIAAIQWVRDHIENFNGDPQSITVWGTGAGAASAGLIAISSKGRELIKRVIAQSGSPMAAWAVQSNPINIRNNSIVVGEHFGCYLTDSYSLIKCLESKSFNEFTQTEVEPEVGWLPFAPVVDYRYRDQDLALVPDHPSRFFDLAFSRLPEEFSYMSGMTRDEGSSWLLEDEQAQLRNFVVSPDLFASKIKNFIKVFNVTYNQQAFIDAINFMYSPWIDRSNYSTYRQGLIDMYTDSWVLAGHDKMVKSLISKRVTTYSYVLNYTIQGLVQPEFWSGVNHDTEYFLVSGAPFMEAKYFPSIFNLKEARWTDADRNMSQFFMEAYGNFAKFGNPTPYALFNNIMWHPTQAQNMQFLSVNTTNYTTTMSRDYRSKSAQFWNDYVYSLLNHQPLFWDDVPYSPLESELRAYRASAYAMLLLAIILAFISLLCSCLYCRARRYKYRGLGIDYMPVPNEAGVLHYGPPSKRVNTELPIKLPLSVQNHMDNLQTRPLKYPEHHSRQSSPRSITSDRMINDKHTLV